jgi:hypothetical protein
MKKLLNKRAHGSPISMAANALVILMGLLLIRIASSPYPNQSLLLFIGIAIVACSAVNMF